MATRRIPTRACKKEGINPSHEGITVAKTKNPGINPLHPCENENSSVDQSSSHNKSYPQHADTSIRKLTKRKGSETDNPSKQRHALSERCGNTKKTPVDHKKEARYEPHVNDDCTIEHMDASSDMFDSSTPYSEDITHEEISVLDEQMTGDGSGLTPILKDNSLADNERLEDSSMEVDPWIAMAQRRHVERQPQLPRGVHNIDAFPDSLHTVIYTRDIIKYLKIKERSTQIPETFLEASPELTPRMRGVLMDWLIRVQTHEDIQDCSLHTCVSIIDRYLAMTSVKLTKLQLLGITSLLIATKFLERYAPEISSLCYLTSDTFKRCEVIRFEKRMLIMLGFDLSFPVCTTFLDRYLQVHEDQQSKEVGYLARYILDLSTTKVNLATVLPSELAASAIYLSRRLVIGINEAWTPSLAYYTTFISLSEISDTINDMAQLLYKAPTSKFQGARTKYNTEQYNFISHSKIVSPEIVESHFMAPATGTISN